MQKPFSPEPKPKTQLMESLGNNKLIKLKV